MATTKKELAVTAQSFDLQTLTGDFAEAMAEEMDGLGTMPYDRVKIPSGGGIVFEVPGEDEDNPDMVKELVGVILHHHPVNAYWENKYSGANEAPDCASLNGKVGIVRETGEKRNCEGCPYNQFAEDGSGKPCKNTHRLYILREGNPIPLILTLPPTSLKFLRDYIGKQILLKGCRCYDVITKITLKKEQNRTGIAYSRVVLSLVDKLSDEQRAQTKAMADSLKESGTEIEVSGDDYNTSSGFVEVSEGSEGELPFK